MPFSQMVPRRHDGRTVLAESQKQTSVINSGLSIKSVRLSEEIQDLNLNLDERALAALSYSSLREPTNNSL